MRKAAEEVSLERRQAETAETGVKALMPFDRPFLDYVLTAAADAGYRDICLVIGPEHDAIRRYYGEQVEAERLRFHFAVQQEPLGTADAVLATEQFAGDDAVVILNSDNLYPVEALRGLRDQPSSAVALFDRNGMLEGSNVPADRLVKFAVGQLDRNGCLARIIEKPDQATIDAMPKPVLVSMNCWRMRPVIYEACRRIEPSPRGELELPDAVTYAMEHLDEPFQVVTSREPVLDLSSREDITTVGELLKGRRVAL